MSGGTHISGRGGPTCADSRGGPRMSGGSWWVPHVRRGVVGPTCQDVTTGQDGAGPTCQTGRCGSHMSGGSGGSYMSGGTRRHPHVRWDGWVHMSGGTRRVPHVMTAYYLVPCVIPTGPTGQGGPRTKMTRCHSPCHTFSKPKVTGVTHCK